MFNDIYDVIVVGGGHAGCEAAAAAANLGSKTLLITMDMAKFAQMSCNPAMGGIAKGQIVREIDALGGYSGIVTDKTMIQFRMLNKSKGPAMWSPRAQSDRTLFSIEWRKLLESTPHLEFWQDTVIALSFKGNTVTGVRTSLGIEFKSKTTILTNGTFLNGLMHIGPAKIVGGRSSEMPSLYLSEQIEDIGFIRGRMKTGTPARIDGRSINFEKLIEQKGDVDPSKFSYSTTTQIPANQLSCFITYTNPDVHKILNQDIDNSPMFNGTIQSIGPRYCPSIESKLVTFADKDKHQLFLEPEGRDTVEYYINGFSSSLPYITQYNALKKVHGLENVKLFRPGYAIEYDYFEPTQLYHTLETKQIGGLYFAGQINGTTGYEEAGAQGLIAGINAHQKTHGGDDFILSRDEAYIGVLIDDLVTKGVDEPYRMFTSRAEHRILLRQDNADNRLTEKAYKIGLAKKEQMDLLHEKRKYIQKLISFSENYSVEPKDINSKLTKLNTSELTQKTKLKNLILRPQVKFSCLIDALPQLKSLVDSFPYVKDEIINSAEIEIKYSGYIEREKIIAEKLQRLEHIKLPDSFNYDSFTSISTEARQKLSKIKPKTIGQARRISGVSPSDINVLLVYMGR